MNNSLVIIGVVLLVIGLASGIYTTAQTGPFGWYNFSSVPYAAYTIPLFVGGIILIIVGALVRKNNE